MCVVVAVLLATSVAHAEHRGFVIDVSMGFGVIKRPEPAPGPSDSEALRAEAGFHPAVLGPGLTFGGWLTREFALSGRMTWQIPVTTKLTSFLVGPALTFDDGRFFVTIMLGAGGSYRPQRNDEGGGPYTTVGAELLAGIPLVHYSPTRTLAVAFRTAHTVDLFTTGNELDHASFGIVFINRTD